MASQKSINIKFPLQDSVKGFFLETNKTSIDALKSDILHVLLSQKNQRWFFPEFGTNLYKYLFEPEDGITLTDIKNEANASLKQAIPNVQLTQLTTTITADNTINLNIVATNSDGVFSEQIFMTVQF